MSPDEIRRAIDRFLGTEVAEGHFPGAAYRLVRAEGVVAEGQLGLRRVVPEPELLLPGAVFDVASLTKPLITATVAMRLVEMGRLSLEQTLDRLVPEAPWGKQICIEDLLLHTSGLPAWRPLHEAGDPWRALLEVPLEREPGTSPVYSCLGFILLGRALEALTGQTLRHLGQDLVIRPLGLRRSRFSGDSTDAVPTELSVSAGTVHDDNARSLGGVPGNSGLFASCEDVGLYASAFLRSLAGHEGLLRPDTARQMIQPRTEGVDEARGLGWLVQAGFRTSAGEAMGPRAFGHTGFTGCSLFFDPDRGLGVVLLTNRVHPHGRPTPMFDIRRRFHDLCCALFDTLSA
jgi:CubicO group peptidase (beta-lactamase class C family)